MKGLQSIFYAMQLSEMSNEQLFCECMRELYPHSILASKPGCLIQELMERIEPVKKDV